MRHREDQDTLIPEVAGCLQERDAKGPDSDTKPGHLVPVALSAMPMNSGKNYTVRPTDVAQPITTVQAGNHNHGGDFILQPAPEAFNIQHNDGGAHKRKDRPNGGMYVKETDTSLTVGTTDLTAIVEPKCFGIDEEQNAAENLMGCLKARKEGGGFEAAVCFHPTQDPISHSDGSTHAMGTGSKQGCATVAVAFRNGNSAKTRSMGESIDLSPTIPSESGGNKVCVSFAQNQLGEVRIGDVAGTVNTNSNASGRNTAMAQIAMSVRRLTPTECERLQGFPDGWTSGFSDSARYKMLGNAVCVNVSEWIAMRLIKEFK